MAWAATIGEKPKPAVIKATAKSLFIVFSLHGRLLPQHLTGHKVGHKLAQRPTNVRFGSKADICVATSHVRFTLNSDRESGFRKRSCPLCPQKRTFALHYP